MAQDSLIHAIPGYRLIKQIGHGASGTVWLADEPLSGRKVAVKVLLKSNMAQQGFSRELDGIRQFQQIARGHNDIIQILKLDETADCYYYSMELADDAITSMPFASNGDASTYKPRTLRIAIDEEAPVDPDRALDMIEHIVRGLDHLHTKKLIHRDVKPANILFVDGRPKLGDLGLVTANDRDATMIGTPGYLPPDDRIDQTADLYGAGKVLYELITGLPRDRHPALPVQLPPPGPVRRRFFAAMRVSNNAAARDRQKRFDSARSMLDYIGQTRSGLVRVRRWALVASIGLVLAPFIALGLARNKNIWASGSPLPPTTAARFSTLRIVPRSEPNSTDWGFHVTFDDGVENNLSFPSPSKDAVVGEFWPGKSSVAVGFSRVGRWAGKLMIFDALDCRTISRPKPVFEERFCNLPPAAWDFQDHRPLICDVAAQVATNLDGIPGDELVVTSCHDDGSCEIVVEGPPGQRLGTFWHYGWIDEIQAADLDEDGTKELICRGVANRREFPKPFGRRHEPLHSCAFVLKLQSLEAATGYWGSEPWMSEGSTVSPEAYGYVLKSRSSVHGHWMWGQGEVFLGPKGPVFRAGLSPDMFLDLNADLTAIRAAYSGGQGHENQQPPDVKEIWKQTWPPDTDSAKDRPPGGE